MSKFVLTAQLQLQAPRNTQQVINQLRGQLQGAVNIPVNVQGAVQATKQINQVNQAAQKATTAGERMGKAFGASIKRFAAFNIATRAVGLLASKLSQAVDESIAFQRELIKISQVTGRTVTQLESLTGTITKLSTTLGVSSTSLLQTSRILAQAGIQANDLDVALSALAKTTLAPTFDNITETAEGAVAILAQFGLGVGELEKQLGAINAVSGQFAVESGDLISAVRRTGGVFRQAGGDLNELLGLFTSVRATTRENAESIATGLRTIFTRIQRPQTIEYLKQFGVQLTDLEGRFVGPFEAVRQLSTALAGLEQGDIRFVQIAEELGGFRQIGKVIPLIQQFEVAERARQAAIDGGNSLTEDAATAQQALAVQIEKTREKFLALIRSISETSTFQIMIKSVLGIANAFIKVAESIKPLIPLIAAFAAVKLTRGIGSFVSGIGAGVRGKNQGGKIHAFASGGFVPGTGNRDTVPAMLTPGEFVIRKSSVNKIGTDTLTAMNAKGYKDGGLVEINPNKSDQAIQVIVNERNNAANASAIPPIRISLPQGRNSPIKKFTSGDLKRAGIERLGFSAPLTVSGFNDNNFEKAKLSIQDTINNTIDSLSEQAEAIGGTGTNLKKTKEKIKKSFRTGIGRIFEEYITDLARIDSPGNRNFDILPITDPAKKNKIGGLSTTEAYNPSNYGEIKLQESIGQFQDIIKKAANQGFFNEAIQRKIDAAPKRSRGRRQKEAEQKALGGKIHQFATGGFVPGTGNRDTVPAMLTPGEFVIRKSSVKKIGVDNLAAMNVKGYNGGGYISPLSISGRPTPEFKRYLQTVRGVTPKDARSTKYAASVAQQHKQDFEQWQDAQKKAKADEIRRKEAAEANALRQQFPGGVFKTIPGRIGAFYLNPAQGKDDAFASRSRREFKLNGQDAVLLSGSQASGFSPGKRDLEKSSTLARMVRTNVKSAIDKGLRSIVPNFANALDVGPIDVQSTQFEESIRRAATDKNIVSTTSGFMFEGIIDAITGAAIKGGRSDFDFNRSSIATGASKLNQMFGSDAVGGLFAADAKFSAARRTDVFKKAVNSIKKGKLIGTAIQQFADGGIADFKPSLTVRSRSGYGDVGRKKQYLAQMVDYLKQNVDSLTPEMQQQLKGMIARQKSMQSSRTQRFSKRLGFATGGSVSDTVPAMLTPGEFVINKKASQSIGYGNLNRMNKQGVVGFAKGGPVGVQYLNEAGIVKPAQELIIPSEQIDADFKEAIDPLFDIFKPMLDALEGIKSILEGWDQLLQSLKDAKASPDQKAGSYASNRKKLEEQAKEAIKSGDASKIGEGADKEARGLTGKAKGPKGDNKGSEAEQTQATLQRLAFLTTAIAGAGVAATSFAEKIAGADSFTAKFVGRMSEAATFMTTAAASVKGFGESLGINSFKDLQDVLNKNVSGLLKSKAANEAAAASEIKEVAANNASVASEAREMAATNAAAASDAKEAVVSGVATVADTGEAVASTGVAIALGPFAILGIAIAAIVAGIYSWVNALKDEAKARQDKAEERGDITGFVDATKDLVASEEGKQVAGLGLIAATGPVGMLAAGGLEAAGVDVSGLGSSITSLLGFHDNLGEALAENSDRIRAISYKGVENALAKSAKEIDQAGKDLAAGLISSSEAAEIFAASGADREFAKQDKILQDLERAQKEEAKASGGYFDFGGFLGMGRSAQEIEEAQAASEATAATRRENARKVLERKQFITDKKSEEFAVSGASFEQFFAGLDDYTKAQYEQSGLLDQLRTQYENQKKAIQENIKFLQALNFGFRDVAGKAMAVSGSMDRLIASQESGFNAFEQNLQILEQSLTEAAVGMDPKQIAAAADNLEQTLIGFGADKKAAKEASDTVKGLSAAQAGASKALEAAAGQLIGPGGGLQADPQAVKKEFTKQIEGQLAGLNLPDNVKERVLNGLGNVDFGSKEVQEQLKSGNFSALIDQSFGPLSEEIKKQLLGPYQERAKQEGILINLTKQRIQLEQQANEAKKKAIDIELEAAQAIEDFGGRQLTAADKISFVNRKLDVDLKAAGVRGVGSGSANELAAVQQNILADFNNLQNESNVAAQRGTGAFGGVGGAEKDKRPQLEAAQQALIEATRQRISLIKEELEIVKRKNELEKQSLDKLLSGDIEGFFADQAATGAASALRTGNQALIGSFSASAIGAGLKDLQGQNLAPQQMERIASGALGSLGIQDRRSAQILAGNTAEEQSLRQEGQQLAGILGAAGAGAAQIAEMAVDAQTVVINAARAEMGNAANVPQPQFKATGGMIYANRGMFVPRGTDTVPAMLTPGEFVVNRAAVQRGNNMAILQAMNNGQQASGPAMSRGGTVRYYRDGGDVSGGGMGISMEVANKMAGSLNGFVTAVDKLGQMQLSVKLDTTNVNVNFNGTSFLANLSENIKTEVLNEVRRQIPNIQHSGTGGHQLGGGSVMGS